MQNSSPNNHTTLFCPCSVPFLDAADTSLAAHQKSSNSPKVSPAITVFQAKEIVTLYDAMPSANYVAVKDGQILAVAEKLEQMDDWLQPGNYTLDTQFQHDVLVPGFYESHTHIHILGYVWNYTYVGYFDRTDPQGKKVSGCANKQEILSRLQQAVAATDAAKKVVIAWGYQPNFYEGTPLTIAELDPICPDKPLLLININLHEMYVNSAALKQLGLDASNAPAGFMREDGKLNGRAQEMEAINKLRALFPAFDIEGARKATDAAFAIAHRVGVTTIVDAALGLIPHAYEALQERAHTAGDMRIIAYPLITAVLRKDIQDKGGFAYVRAMRDASTPWMRIGAIKFVIDGSLQAKTARMLWPYYLDGSNGIHNISLDDLKKYLVEAFKQGLQVAMHANGDEAVQYALDATEYALNIVPQADHRTHIEHYQIPTLAQIKRTQCLGINVSALTNHLYFWGDVHWHEILGYNRAHAMHPLKTMVAHNIPVSLQSDFVTPLNPLLMMWIAVNRLTYKGTVLGKQEALTPLEALKAVTLWAAHMQFEDHCKGSIEVGKYADFTILAENPLTVCPKRIKDIAVRATVVGGTVFPID